MYDLLHSGLGGAFGRAGRRRSIGGDLAGFHQLLEAAEVTARLDRRFALQQLGDAAPDRSAGRIVGHEEPHIGPAARRRVGEFDHARRIDIAALLALPGELRSWDVFDQAVDELDVAAGGTLDNPARALVVELLDAPNIVHELGQMADVAPEVV